MLRFAICSNTLYRNIVKNNTLMRKSLILSLFLLLAFVGSSTTLLASKDGYVINVQIKGLKDTVCFLANFYGKNQYYKDTARIDANGNMVFDGKEPLEEGLYTLVLNQSKILDFLVIEQHFSLATDTSDYLKHLKIKGSNENIVFFEYVAYLNQQQKVAAEIHQKMESANEKERTALNEQLIALDKTVKAYQRDFAGLHPSTFAGKFVSAMSDIEVPDPPKNEDGTIDSTFQYRYYKSHYWDNLDFADARYLRTPVYHNMLSRYLEKLTLQYPDSLIKEIDLVVNKARANYELFQYSVSWITNTYEKSNIMGMDAIFVHMAETYYLTDDVGWIDSTQRAKIEERYTKTKPLLLGKKAPNVILADTAQKEWFNLHKLDAKYTILYIWSPTCGHCKKITPKMHDLYLKYKDQGVKVFAIGTEYENVEWLKYIRDNKLSWINVSDSPEYPNNVLNHPNNFRENYDVFSTPKIYLLDKDKKIIAKKLEDEQLDDMIGRLLKEDGSHSGIEYRNDDEN
jgi:thiol-disulfide isomerase/thioredoxin